MDETFDYRQDYPQAVASQPAPPCGISRGPRRGFRTRCLPHWAEVHQSDTCTGAETSHTTVAAADSGHNHRHCSGRAALTQEVVAARTTALDCAINPRVCVRNRRQAEEPRDDHGSHRDDDRPHNRLTLVQADLPSEPNRLRTRKERRNEDAPHLAAATPTTAPARFW
jgi:hypothetical protein